MSISDWVVATFRLVDIPSMKEILTLAPPIFYPLFMIAVVFFVVRLITRLL